MAAHVNHDVPRSGQATRESASQSCSPNRSHGCASLEIPPQGDPRIRLVDVLSAGSRGTTGRFADLVRRNDDSAPNEQVLTPSAHVAHSPRDASPGPSFSIRISREGLATKALSPLRFPKRSRKDVPIRFRDIAQARALGIGAKLRFRHVNRGFGFRQQL